MCFFGKEFLVFLFMVQSAALAQVPAPPVQDQTQDEETALEKARLLETVDRDYEQALNAYRALSDREKKVAFWARAELGAARCLMKLGRYDEAEAVLQDLVKPGLPEEIRNASTEMLATVRRLNNSARPGYASSVDNLVWQLLDAAAGTDANRAKSARAELVKMGNLALPVLKEMARAKDYFKSVTAFYLLKEIGGEESYAFMKSCALDPDLALRKRCVDGVDRGYIPPEMVPLLVYFLEGEEKTLRMAAINVFSDFYRPSFSATNKVPRESLQLIADLLYGFCFGEDEELRSEALNCIDGWVRGAKKNFADNLPVQKLCAVAERLFEEHPPEMDYGPEDQRILNFAINIALPLGRDFDRKHLLERTIRYWPLEAKAVLEAAWALGPEGLGWIVNDTLSSKDPEKLEAMDSNFKLYLFTDLPEDARERFLAYWASSISGISTDARSFLKKPWDAHSWSIILKGLLDNPQNKLKRVAVNELVVCPDPKDPRCFEALLLWTSHPDLQTRRDGLKAVSELIESRKLDPGPEGALRIVEGSIAAESGRLELRRKPDGKSDILPVSIVHALGTLRDAVQMGALEAVKQWLLEQKTPGLLDVVAGYEPLLRDLIRDDHEFTAQLWNRIGPSAKEALFKTIYGMISRNLSQSKPKWLVPMLKGWEFDRDWDKESIRWFIYVLGAIGDPDLVERVRETVIAFLELPNIHDQNSIVAVTEVIKNLPPQSDAVLELLPLWYSKIQDYYSRQLDRFLSTVIQASSRNLSRALRWLAEDHDPAFKEKVIQNIFSGKKDGPEFLALFESLDLNGQLRNAWPGLSEDTRDKLLRQLISSDASKTCGGFFLTLLRDPKTRADRRHLAYAALWRTGESQAVQPLLEYLKNLAPGEETGPLKGTAVISTDVLKATESAFSLLRNSASRYNVRWLSDFTPEDKQRLNMGILSEPVHRDWLTYYAADNVKISNASDYARVKELLESDASRFVRYDLLGIMVEYLLRDRTPDRLQSKDRLPEVPGEAIELLSNALNSLYDSESGGPEISHAVELVGEYKVEALLEKVSEIAASHPSPNLRFKAVECLENFRNPEMVPALIECLKDSRSDVRKKAKEILDRMREYEDQKRAWEAYLGEEGAKGKSNSTATALIEMLKNEDPEVRLYAIKSLGKLGDPNTLPILVELVASGSEEEKAAAKAAIDAITE